MASPGSCHDLDFLFPFTYQFFPDVLEPGRRLGHGRRKNGLQMTFHADVLTFHNKKSTFHTITMHIG